MAHSTLNVHPLVIFSIISGNRHTALAAARESNGTQNLVMLEVATLCILVFQI